MQWEPVKSGCEKNTHKKDSVTGNRTRACWVRASYPNHQTITDCVEKWGLAVPQLLQLAQLARMSSSKVWSVRGLRGAIGQRVRLLTERLVVRAHPGALSFATHFTTCECYFKKIFDPGRIRTCNLLIRSQTRYPLRHETNGVHDTPSVEFTRNSN